MGKFAALLCTALVVWLSACGGESETVEEPLPAKVADTTEPSTSNLAPPTATPETPTDTPVPPTLGAFEIALTQSALTREIATPIPTLSVAEVQFEVLWDGSKCVVGGPEEVPIGNYQFVFKDPFNDVPEQRQDLWISNLIDGHTFQDFIDKQSEPGEYIGKPSWLIHANGMRKWDDEIGAEIVTFDLGLEGEYAIYLGNNTSIWLCRPLMVVKETTE